MLNVGNHYCRCELKKLLLSFIEFTTKKKASKLFTLKISKD